MHTLSIFIHLDIGILNNKYVYLQGDRVTEN